MLKFINKLFVIWKNINLGEDKSIKNIRGIMKKTHIVLENIIRYSQSLGSPILFAIHLSWSVPYL